MPANVRQAIAALQRVDHLGVAANDGDRLVAIDNLVEQTLGEIGTRGDRKIEPRACAPAPQNAAVVQQQPRLS